MKIIVFACVALSVALSSYGQDSTIVEKVDTIRVGGMIIIKKKSDSVGRNQSEVRIANRKRSKPSNVSTNWWIVDLGFANLNDKTNYTSAAVQSFAPGFSNKDQLNLKTGKSSNINIWLFMQKLNMIQHVVNLKYGLGVELNNYRFDDEKVRLSKNPTIITIDPTLAGVDKNKLSADYVTLPAMLNLNFTPNRKKGFGISDSWITISVFLSRSFIL